MIEDLRSTVELSNGVRMPWLGFGTYKIPPGRGTFEAVRTALEAGYRHIDTASYYRNEADVGRAIRESGVPREEVFVTTKLWNDEQGYREAHRAFRSSLDRLNMDYVDLYLIHWPVSGKYKDSWRALEEIHDDGGARAIGVSNFMIEHLEDLNDSVQVRPAVDQVEFHPHLYLGNLLEYCRNQAIQPEAWSPLKQGCLPGDLQLEEIGSRHGKTGAQVAIRWVLQHGLVAIPRTVRGEHMVENAEVFDFRLTEEEMRRVDSMDRRERVGPDPYSF